jgi:hypothetical protein
MNISGGQVTLGILFLGRVHAGRVVQCAGELLIYGPFAGLLSLWIGFGQSETRSLVMALPRTR